MFPFFPPNNKKEVLIMQGNEQTFQTSEKYTLKLFVKDLLADACYSFISRDVIGAQLCEDKYWKDFVKCFYLEFFKSQITEQKNCIDQKEFLKRFEKFRFCVFHSDIRGERSEKMKSVMGEEIVSYDNKSDEFFASGAKCRKFFSHFIKNDEILEDTFLLYAVMYSIWLYGNNSQDEEIKKTRAALLSYREKTSSNLEMRNAVAWCVQCCAEIYFDIHDLLKENEIDVTIYGVNSFLGAFNYHQVSVKDFLRRILFAEFEKTGKKLPIFQPYTFMLNFHIHSLYTKKPFWGEWGKARENKNHEIVRMGSGDYQYAKRYLKEYFAPEFDEDIKYKYFQAKFLEREKSGYLSEEEGKSLLNVQYNQFISYIFILLDPPEDNYFSISLYRYLKDYILSEIGVLEAYPDLSEQWLQQFMYIRSLIDEKIDLIKHLLRETTGIFQNIQSNMENILEKGRMDVPDWFLEELKKIDCSDVRKTNDGEIGWIYSGNIKEIYMEIYFEMLCDLDDYS